MSLFDGLEIFGLSGIKGENLFEDPVEKRKKEKIVQEVKQIHEEDLLFEKNFECPVCDKKFKQWVVRGNKARLMGSDKDLRPHHEHIDSTKYDVVFCNRCGYAALMRYYGPLAKPHRDLLKENVYSKFKPMAEPGMKLSYEDALIRYKMALYNAMCRQAKSSEKAYICLKTGWVYRGMQEQLGEDVPADAPERKELLEKEEESLKNALEGLMLARETETPPIAGMNLTTLDYLLAVLCVRFGRLEDAMKLLQELIRSTSASNAQKEKARDLVLEIRQKMKEKE